MSDTLPETLFERYTPLRLLGKGPNSTVYLVQPLGGGAPVALKILSADLLARIGPERFVSEFRTLARLRHPNIIRVFEFGSHEGQYYYTMEYLDAPTLEDRKELVGNESGIARLLYELALALDFLHTWGVLHGDLKPGNIFLTPEGARLTDFGLALRLHGESAGISGTLPYIPPERWKRAPFDARCDLYALGIVLWEAFTGRLPFPGPGVADFMRQHLEAPLPRPQKISPELWHLLERMTAKRPAERPASAGQVAEMIADLYGYAEKPVATPSLRPDFQFEYTDAGGRLAAVNGLLESGPRGIWVIGERGSGRTRLLRELAIQRAEQGLDAIPLDHALYPPISIAERLAEALRPFLLRAGMPPLEETKPEALRAAMQSLAETRPLILLADNLAPAEGEVLGSLLPEDFPVVMTGATAPPDASSVTLNPFTAEEIRDLLTNALGPDLPDPERLTAFLTQKSLGLPALLSFLVGEIGRQGILTRTRKGWSLAWDRLESLHLPSDYACLHRTRIESLPGPERDLLRLLADFTAPLPEEILPRLLGSPEGEGADLEPLLVRLESEGLLRRLYLGETLYWGFADPLAREAVGELIPADVPPARWLARAALLESLPAEVAVEHAWDVAECYRQGGEVATAIERYRKAGELLRRRKRIESALAAFAAARKLLPTDDPRRVPLLKLTALLYKDRNEYPSALVWYKRALTLATKLKDEREISNITNDLGVIHFEQGDRAKALYYYKKAVTLRRKIADPRLLVASLNNLAAVHVQMGHPAKAVKRFRQALAAARKGNFPKIITVLLVNLGDVYCRSGRIPEARSTLKRALAESRKLDDLPMRFEAGVLLGRLLLWSGRMKSFVALTEELDEVLATLTTPGMVVRRQTLEAERLFRSGEIVEAAQYCRKAIATAGDAVTGEELAPLCVLAARCESELANAGRLDELIAVAEKANLNRSLLTYLQGHRERLAGKREAAARAFTKAAHQAERIRDRWLQAESILALAQGLNSAGKLAGLFRRFREIQKEVPDRFLRAEFLLLLAEKTGPAQPRKRLVAFLDTARKVYGAYGNGSRTERVDRVAVPRQVARAIPDYPPAYRDSQIIPQPPPVQSEEIPLPVERLLEVIEAINAEMEQEALLRMIVDRFLEVNRMERGFLFLATADGELHLEVARDRRQQDLPTESVQVSRSVLKRVVDRRKPEFIQDIPADAELAGQKSVVDLQLRVAVCLPMVYRGTVTGVIYADSQAITSRFSPMELALQAALANQAAIALHNAGTIGQVAETARMLQRELDSRYKFDNLIGRSTAMLQVFERLRVVSATDVTVFIGGETGTGKDLVARTLHFNSPRKAGRFLALNCAAIPENLLESELFGYEKGAFTGATARKAGSFESADGGTLFLDEIAEMSPALQAKILRVIEDRKVRRLGGDREFQVDVRILSASHQDIRRLMAEGRFRQDLYYRIAPVSIQLPPLRQRAGDIPVLARHFLEVANERFQREFRDFAPQVYQAFERHPWPGNVRQLEHVIQQMAIFGSGETLMLADLPQEFLEEEPSTDSPVLIEGGLPGIPESYAEYRTALAGLVRDYERKMVEIVLARYGGNIRKAAEGFGIQRTYLHKIMRDVEIM